MRSPPKHSADSGAPSVSIAIVQGGKVAFEKAYGKARLDPAADATTEMRYSIGSVSKQFLAGACCCWSRMASCRSTTAVCALSSEPDAGRERSPSVSYSPTHPDTRTITRRTTWRRSWRSR